MKPPRILIVRLSALGDILHALPLLAAVRGRWPEAHVGWLAEPAGASILQDHPLIDRLHIVPKKELKANPLRAWRGSAGALLRELKAEQYTVALDVQGLSKSAMWPWLARIPRRIALARPDAREIAPTLATVTVQPPAGAWHVIERNLALLGPLGIGEADPLDAPIHFSDAARERATAILGPGTPAHPLVLLALGAGWATKIWAAERFGALARRLADEQGARVALTWGPGEEPLVLRALAAAGASAPEDLWHPPHERIPDAAGLWPLPPTRFMELGACIARADLFAGGDTGPTHFAAALKVPTVSMMGPLDARRNGPLGPHCETIQHAIPRRPPRGVNHRTWCDPRTDLAGVTVDEVFAACRRGLAAR